MSNFTKDQEEHDQGTKKFGIREEKSEKKNTTGKIPGIGIICTILSAAVNAISVILIKLVDLHPVQINLSQCAVQFLIILPFLQYKHEQIDITGPRGLKKLLWVRGLLGSTGMMFLYLAVDRLPAGNALTVSYLRIIMVPFIARVLVKDSLSIFDLIFALVALTGVVFIARPTFLFPVSDGNNETDAFGVLFALLSALFLSLTAISIRKLGRETHVALHIIYYSVMGSITASIILFGSGEFRYPCWKDVPLVFCFGIISTFGQFFVSTALRNEKAGTVVAVRSIQIVFVYIMQITILGDTPSSWSLIGAALIFSTSIGSGIRKARSQGLKTQ